MSDLDDSGNSESMQDRNSSPVNGERRWLPVYLGVVANTALTILLLYLIARFYSG